MEGDEIKLHGHIIEKAKDFLKNNRISKLYRYLKLTGENLDDLVNEIEEKIEGEEEKKKIIALRSYIKRKERLEKEKKNLIKKTSEDLFNILDDKRDGKQFDEKFKNAPLEIQDTNIERFEQFGRLSKLFSDWKKNPDSKFRDEYQKIIGDEVGGDSVEAPNHKNTDVGNPDETGNIGGGRAEDPNPKNTDVGGGNREPENISGDKLQEKVENKVGLQKNYCLFNLIDRKSSQGFTLSNFVNQNNISLGEKESLNCDLVNAISIISLDNFCEQEGFYRGMLFDSNSVVSTDEGQSNAESQGVVDFSLIELMSPSSITYEECMTKIRNSIAHGDFMYLREESGVNIYINDKKGFEALVNPSFFDDGFCLGQYASDISCDFILGLNKGDSWKENIYEYTNKGERIQKLVNYLGPKFRENFTTILDDKYNAVRIDLNQEKWKKELEIINSENPQDPGLLFGLLSDNERPYVHNLLNAVSVSMLNKVLSNPNITYNELFNDLAVEAIGSERNLFTFHDRDKIIKLCLDMLPDLLMLQGLKAFYVNILEIPENRTLKQRENAHIRNALIHGYYKIAKGKIIIWDFDIKRNKETLEKRIYDIETLRNEAQKCENFYHSRKNGFNSLVKGIGLTKKSKETL